MAWIELHQTLPSHRKTLRLMSRLRLRRSQVVGHLTLLWLWALDNAKDGALDGVSERELAQVADFNPKRAGELVDALVDAGFLDRAGEKLRIHDWEDYGGTLEESRKKLRERRKRYKDKLREETHPETYPETDIARLQYTTQENNTQQNNTEQDITNSISADGGGAHAEAGERMREYLLTRGLLPEAWLGSEPEMVDECRALGDALFHAFVGRRPTEADQARVFQGVMRQWQDGDGRMRCSIDEDRRDLLHYAFEQAALTGKPGNWSYIQGVLQRLHERGICDLHGVADYELDREGL